MEIWKFDLPIQDTPIISMPEGAKILSLQVQEGVPRIWALVNPQNDMKSRFFHIIGTGHNFKESTLGSYVGTFITAGETFVGHVFEI